MPRSRRVRSGDGPVPGPTDPERQSWLARWKCWAVAELPSDTSRGVRAQVRAAVERALSRFTPRDDESEIRDAVAGVVEEARGRLSAETDQARHARSKQETLAGVRQLLEAVLAQFPRREVAAMLKRPGYSHVALTDRLRRFLDRHLTGAESPQQVAELIVAWVERRLGEQPDPPRRMSAAVKTAMTVAAAGAVVALQDPRVRDATIRQLTKARNKARTWLEKLILLRSPRRRDQRGHDHRHPGPVPARHHPGPCRRGTCPNPGQERVPRSAECPRHGSRRFRSSGPGGLSWGAYPASLLEPRHGAQQAWAGA